MRSAYILLLPYPTAAMGYAYNTDTLGVCITRYSIHCAQSLYFLAFSLSRTWIVSVYARCMCMRATVCCSMCIDIQLAALRIYTQNHSTFYFFYSSVVLYQPNSRTRTRVRGTERTTLFSFALCRWFVCSQCVRITANIAEWKATTTNTIGMGKDNSAQ